MEKLTKETISNILGWESCVEDCVRQYWKEQGITWYDSFKSPCGRFILTTIEESNLTNDIYGWNLHIDNSDMESIGWNDVEYIEQVQTLMNLYKDY